jgi:hypothetical protein
VSFPTPEGPEITISKGLCCGGENGIGSVINPQSI